MTFLEKALAIALAWAAAACLLAAVDANADQHPLRPAKIWQAECVPYRDLVTEVQKADEGWAAWKALNAGESMAAWHGMLQIVDSAGRKINFPAPEFRIGGMIIGAQGNGTIAVAVFKPSMCLWIVYHGDMNDLPLILGRGA